MNKKTLLFFTLLLILLSVSYYLLKKRGKIRVDHIFLITIDTLRADHLSCYGYPRKITPFIDNLAKEGIIFNNAYSNIASTAPAHSSIFTGLYPRIHGVLKNWFKLDERFQTIAEILKEKGFKTYAFTSVGLFGACNLYQGFDFYNEPIDPRIKKKYGKKYRDAKLTFRKIKEYFSSFKKKENKDKHFIWIHLFDPHRPYYPPNIFLSKIKNLTDKRKMINFWEKEHRINPLVYKGEVFKHREKNRYFKEMGDLKHEGMSAIDIMYEQINLYDAEIMYMDSVLREIFFYFEKKGLNKHSLWIITGDHGEGLGNHNWFTHAKHIYKEHIHIPLIFYFNNKEMGKKITEVVEHPDILPTIIDLLSLNNKEKDTLSGKSLIHFIYNSGKKYNKSFSFAQREVFKTRKQLKKIPDYVVYEKGDKYSIIDKRYHYIYKTTGVEEFFNIIDDPYEIHSLLRGTSLRRKYKGILFKLLKKIKRKTTVKKASEKEIRKIKSLGYVE